MSLSKTERLILANQYRILALLEPDQKEDHEAVRDALQSGYVSAYEQLFDHIYDDFTREQCSFVVDVLSVFDALQNSYAGLKDKSGIDENRLAFPGFSGNEETIHMAYCRYVMESEGRFDYLKKFGKDCNSHMPMIPTYRRMVAKHAELGERQQLTKSEIQSILETR